MMKRKVASFSAALLFFSLIGTPPVLAAQVTSGLLIDLNTANPNSYPGSGTTWIDLAGGDDTATLTNGPVFDTATGSGFIHDGTNDYTNIANRAALQPVISSCSTMIAWAKVIVPSANDGIMGKMFGSSGGYDGYALLLSGTNGVTLKMNGSNVDQTTASGNNVYTTGAWTMFTYVACPAGGSGNPNKVYINSTLTISAGNTESSFPSPSAPIQLANGIQDGFAYGNIKIGAFAFYNRALSAQEIADSYDYYSNYLYVQEVSTIVLNTSGNAGKGLNFTISATVGAAGRVRFFINGKRIPTCLSVITSGSPMTATCTWKPATSGVLMITATLTPVKSGLSVSSASKTISVSRRTNTR
jgi:hypothetical protein